MQAQKISLNAMIRQRKTMLKMLANGYTFGQKNNNL